MCAHFVSDSPVPTTQQCPINVINELMNSNIYMQMLFFWLPKVTKL